MALDIKKRTQNGVTVFDLKGRVIFGEECVQLRDQVKAAITAGEKNIVLNLAEVEYMDSGGIGTLVGLFTSSRSSGGDIRLAAANEKVAHVLDITRLTTVISLFPDVARAIKPGPQKASA